MLPIIVWHITRFAKLSYCRFLIANIVFSLFLQCPEVPYILVFFVFITENITQVFVPFYLLYFPITLPVLSYIFDLYVRIYWKYYLGFLTFFLFTENIARVFWKHYLSYLLKILPRLSYIFLSFLTIFLTIIPGCQAEQWSTPGAGSAHPRKSDWSPVERDLIMMIVYLFRKDIQRLVTFKWKYEEGCLLVLRCKYIS